MTARAYGNAQLVFIGDLDGFEDVCLGLCFDDGGGETSWTAVVEDAADAGGFVGLRVGGLAPDDGEAVALLDDGHSDERSGVKVLLVWLFLVRVGGLEILGVNRELGRKITEVKVVYSATKNDMKVDGTFAKKDSKSTPFAPRIAAVLVTAPRTPREVDHCPVLVSFRTSFSGLASRMEVVRLGPTKSESYIAGSMEWSISIGPWHPAAAPLTRPRLPLTSPRRDGERIILFSRP